MTPANTKFSRRLLPVLAALLAVACLAPVAAGAAEIRTVTAPTTDGGVRSYWTPERMRAAVPLDLPSPPGTPGAPAATPLSAPASSGPPTAVGAVEAGSPLVALLQRGRLAAGERRRADPPVDRSEVEDPSQAPFHSHGKVFLTIAAGSFAGDYVCSGTALSSNNRSVVWTAGHCVFDDSGPSGGGGGYVTNFSFVPAYHDGEAPFGEWPAEELATTDQWQPEGNLSYDLGAAVVAENAEGQTLAEVVGGRGIGFNQPRTQNYSSFGYPAQQPPLEFTGGRMFRCDSPLGGSDNPPGSGPSTSWISCDMSGGSSGGGWVAGGTVLSVNSYSYCLEDPVGGLVCEERLYGPYQGDVAQDLYEAVGGKAELCANAIVTILGTDGDDELIGTNGADVIKTGDGDDLVVGKGGGDRICAGPGRDLLKGGDGKDKLKGQGGSDVLRGNKGSDACNGGGGKDKAGSSCEKVSKVP